MEATISASPGAAAQERLTWHVVVSQRKLDDFMKAAGMFEPFKFLVERVEEPIKVSGVLKEGITVAQSCQDLRNAIERDGTYQVLAVWCENEPDGAWRHPAARVISTGQKWMMFDDYLGAFGAPATLLPAAEHAKS